MDKRLQAPGIATLATPVEASASIVEQVNNLLLITPAVWSRIIGRVENESTPFLNNLFVRRKIKQNDRNVIYDA